MTTNTNIPSRNKSGKIESDFSHSDIIYLASTFNIRQLRTEQNHALYSQANAFIKHDTQNELYYRDYAAACHDAIELIRSRQPIRNTTTKSKFVDIEALKASWDIVEVAERYAKLMKAGRNFKALCPLHAEKSPSFFVYPDKQTWRCYGACSTGGDIISLVIKAEHVDFKSAVAILGGNQ